MDLERFVWVLERFRVVMMSRFIVVIEVWWSVFGDVKGGVLE